MAISNTDASSSAAIDRLNRVLAQVRKSEDAARQEGRLLKEIVNHLPVALTVQDADGRFLLVNDVAARNLATSAETLIGASPADFLSPEDAAGRRDWEMNLTKTGRASTVEESIVSDAGEQTWLTSHKPVRVLDRTLLLTSSLDITERKQ